MIHLGVVRVKEVLQGKVLLGIGALAVLFFPQFEFH